MKNIKKYCNNCVHHHYQPIGLIAVMIHGVDKEKHPDHICLRLSVLEKDAVGERVFTHKVNCEIANKLNDCQYHKKWWEFWKR